jgi:hypothetical protein
VKYRNTRIWLRLTTVSAHACQKQATAVASQQGIQLRRYSGLSGLFFSFLPFLRTRNHFRGMSGYSVIGFRHKWSGAGKSLPSFADNPGNY